MAPSPRKSKGKYDGHENDAGQDYFIFLMKQAGLDDLTIGVVQKGWSYETFRKYRRTLTRFRTFLEQVGAREDCLLDPMAGMVMVARFATHVRKAGFSPDNVVTMGGHLNKIRELFDPRSAQNLAARVLQGIRREAPKHSRRYSTIWELDVLLGWLRRNWTDDNALNDHDLETKAMMLTMVFSACRLAELARMETPTDSEVGGRMLWLRTVTKQHWDKKDRVVLHPVAEPALCPVATIRAWLERRRKWRGRTLFPALTRVRAAKTQRDGREDPDAVAPSEDTSLNLRSAEIARAFVTVMRKAGIDSSYTAYSIKHAVITKLFRAGASEEQIVEFGRWAQNSNTPRKWYNIQTLEEEWLGTRLLASSLAIPESKALEGFTAGYLPPTRTEHEAQVRVEAQHWILDPLPDRTATTK
jgi:site-specific recombinase XerD